MTRSSARHQRTVRAPNAWLMLLEARAPWEMAVGLAASPLLQMGPSGDGHPVLVFPGLAASDTSTWMLRRFLRARGYTPYGWGLGSNRGPRAGVLEACRERIDELARRHATPVSLVGWSLGGLYARELAKDLEAQTRCVITLGTPFAGHPRANNARRLYDLLNGQRIAGTADSVARLRHPPNVPTTSIYSKSDGVVAWQCSVNPERPNAENIEVESSHIGMAMNPLVLHAVADRLYQKPATWQRFDRRGVRSVFYAAGAAAA